MALPDSVTFAHALNPTNDSERQLFRHLLETLVRVDCTGRVRPGLAESWTSHEGGGEWTFMMGDDARLPGNSPATPLHVAASLRNHQRAGNPLGIDTVNVVDQRRVRVRLGKSGDTLPLRLADPAVAVTGGLASEEWPLERVVVPTRADRPAIEFQVAADPRDALDRGADLMVTRDPALVEYAVSRPGLSSFPLPWSRTYVLVEPDDGPRELTAAVDAQPVRKSLAQDAVRAHARASEGPYWWADSSRCSARPASALEPRSSRIVYPSDDAVARDLAERLIALLPSDAGLQTAGLARARFSAALRAGSERGYITFIPRQTLVPCRESLELPKGASITPLIDTRAHAIVRRGAPPLSIDWDGTVRVMDRNMASEEQP